MGAIPIYLYDRIDDEMGRKWDPVCLTTEPVRYLLGPILSSLP